MIDFDAAWYAIKVTIVINLVGFLLAFLIVY